MNEDSCEYKHSTSKRVQEYDDWIKDNKINKLMFKRKTHIFKDLLKQKEKFLEKKHSEQQEEYKHNSSVVENDPGLQSVDDALKYEQRKTVSDQSQFLMKKIQSEDKSHDKLT